MPPLTSKDLCSRFQSDLRHAEQVLIKDGHLAPFYAVTSAEGRLVPVSADFGSPEGREASLTAVRLLCIAEDAVVASHMAEAWMVVGDLTPGVSPSQSERRVEVVLVAVDGRVGGAVERLSSAREIVRGPDGKPTGLRPLGIPGSGEEGSADQGAPPAQLLPPQRPTQEQRLVAQAALLRMGVVRPGKP